MEAKNVWLIVLYVPARVCERDRYVVASVWRVSVCLSNVIESSFGSFYQLQQSRQLPQCIVLRIYCNLDCAKYYSLLRN